MESQNNPNPNYTEDDLAQAEFNDMVRRSQAQPQPTTNYETAVFLIGNSEVTTELAEIEKEVKLSNLPKDWCLSVLKLLKVYQDQIMFKEIQLKKYGIFVGSFSKKEVEAGTITLDQKKFLDSVDSFVNMKFDKLNALRSALAIASVSRGRDGFERKQLNTVVSSQDLNQTLSEAKQQGVFGRVFGGKF